MLLLVLRRMLSSKWMVICLLIGYIMATALVSCIPIYTDGILQRMLTKDLENFQIDSGTFPGSFRADSALYYIDNSEEKYKFYSYFDRKLDQEIVKSLKTPVITSHKDIVLTPGSFEQYVPHSSRKKNQYVEIGAISGFQEHATITHGRMFSNTCKDGVFEVVITDKAMKELNLNLDRIYTVKLICAGKEKVYNFKAVGVYTFKDPKDPYWDNSISQYSKRLSMDFELLMKEFVQKDPNTISSNSWFYALDYHKLTIRSLPDIINSSEAYIKWAQKYGTSFALEFPALKILKKYNERSAQLKTTLWVLIIPIMLMLMFYIFMVSQLVVGSDENGIAVLKSRGAGNIQIFISYLIESFVLGAIAMLAGPPLGLLLCTILGSANGFLEFIQRTALPVQLNSAAYLYSLAAVGVLVVTMLAPVVIQSRTTIVEIKQNKSRSSKTAIWKKFYLDIVILGISAYGLYRYNQQQKILSLTGVKGTELDIDPLLFLMSTLFILGAGMLFLRLYPYFIRLIYWLGRKIWSPVLYVSLIQVGRSKGQEQFLMLFIILSISIGFFNANSARTINRNIEDKIRYSVAADVTLMARWEDNQPKSRSPYSMMSGDPQQNTKKEPLRYLEPNYNKYSNLSGTVAATKVMVEKKASLQANGVRTSYLTLMGIKPNEFAKVAWFRPDLMKHHWYEYLNLMMESPKAVLLSRNLQEKYQIKKGDNIYIYWGEDGYLPGIVYEFVDYWPGFNPNPQAKGEESPGLVVADLTYIQNNTGVQPYQVWFKKKPGATDAEINEDIKTKKLDIVDVKYANQQLIKAKNDPMLQGTNGVLTLGFVAYMMISMIGFLIYWVISIQSRVLHFGILRAMGLSLRKVIGMLACEQLLVSGVAILVGIIVGGITGDTFIPLLQIVYSSAEQVPPFRVVADSGDYIKIYAVVGSILLIGFAILWRIIAGIKMDQALKLGED